MTTIRRQRFKHIIGHTVLLIFGMFLAAFGIACTTTAGLGTTPISTVPYTASATTGLSFGTCTVILNFFFVAGQIVVLRSRYSPFNLLQIPIGFIFGAFIDLSMHLVGMFKCRIGFRRLCFLFLGISFWHSALLFRFALKQLSSQEKVL